MKNRLLLLISAVLTFTSCWKSETPKSFTRPVKLSEASSINHYVKEFIGVTTAKQYTNLAFQVGGLVSNVYVNDGSAVKTGQLLAQLDPQDLILQMQSDKAQYQSSKSILERNERLLAREAISTQDVEVAMANYQKAKSAFEHSQNQVEYTRLRAPFDGSIETKFVEDFQKIAAGEKIFKLINPAILDVNFTLPESDINMTQVDAQYSVRFENLKGQSFKAKIKEVVDASVDGMGIPITLSITDADFDPIKQNIKAGFACKVAVSIGDNSAVLNSYVKVPVTAVFTENIGDTNKYVWVYDPAKATIAKREITTSGLMGSSDIIVSKGLGAGEKVVTAGVYQLVENQKVTVLK